MQDIESQGVNSANRPSRLRIDDLLVDLERHTVRRGSQVLDLTDRSFRLLEVLIRHAPERVDKDQLIAEVWDDTVVSDDTLAQRVRLLRQSLGDDSQKPRYVAAVRGRGYRLIPPPRDSGAVPSNRLPRAMWLAVATILLIGIFLAWRSANSPAEPTIEPDTTMPGPRLRTRPSRVVGGALISPG